MIAGPNCLSRSLAIRDYLLLLIFTSILQPSVTDVQFSAQSYRIPQQPLYLISAPKRIRPDQVMRIVVTWFSDEMLPAIVRANVRGGNVAVANSHVYLYSSGIHMLDMKLPDYLGPDNYTLTVDGSVLSRSEIAAPGSSSSYEALNQLQFHNETQLIFDVKQISVLIQLSKPLYLQGQTIRMRIIPIESNLMKINNRLDVYVIDSTDSIVRRWLYQQPNAGGAIELVLDIADQAHYGIWKVKVLYKHKEYVKTFRVEEFVYTRIDINVTMPLYFRENDFGITGLVIPNISSGLPVRGSGNLRLTIYDPNANSSEFSTLAEINRPIPLFEAKLSFLFTMSEIRKAVGRDSLANLEAVVVAEIDDWFIQIPTSGAAFCYIYGIKPKIKILGGRTRIFKPFAPFTAYIVVQNPDGSPLQISSPFNQLTIRLFKDDEKVSEETMVIPDDGTIQYTFVPSGSTNTYTYRLVAVYDVDPAMYAEAEQLITKAPSQKDAYLRVTTNTRNPMVHQYAIFQVYGNYYMEKIYWILVSQGNIIAADTLYMNYGVLSKTFSVALSRDMTPVSHILVYAVLSDGEILADSLNFYVNLSSRINAISVSFNRAKDLSMKTIEVNVRAAPGTFVMLSILHYDLFRFNGSNVFTVDEIAAEALSYDSHAQMPFIHNWRTSDVYNYNVYFPSTTNGTDPDQTFASAGLVLFSDRDTSFFHTCNATNGLYPCYSELPPECYMLSQRCDGTLDCRSGVDEANCDEKTDSGGSIVGPPDPLAKLARLGYFMDDIAWLYQSFFIKPDGTFDFRVSVPEFDGFFAVAAVGLSDETGLVIQSTSMPVLFYNLRRFFIVLEYATVASFGEQIGIRVTVYNHWHYWTEALIELQASDQFKFIRVGWRGAVSSYAPETLTGIVHNVVLLKAGEGRQVFFPIVPLQTGETTFTICAYSFIGVDCDTGLVTVLSNGVTNYYHTPYFLDLTVAASLWVPDLFIQVPQQFIDPVMRPHLFVPGSERAVVSIYGDVVAPTLTVDQAYTNTERALMKPYGVGEQALFNLAYNVYMLRYMRATSQLGGDVQKQTLTYCNTLLQRIYSFYDSSTGSFSMFRDYTDEPSVWLSAFALKVLLEALPYSDWSHDFFIDSNVVRKTAIWLTSKQLVNCSTDRMCGSFQSDTIFYDRKFLVLNSSMSDQDRELHYNISLAAYVIIAMRDPQNILTDQAAILIRNAKAAAADFIIRNLDTIEDVLELATVSYALQLVGVAERIDAYRLLRAKAHSDQNLYWSNTQMQPNPIEVVNSIHFFMPRNYLTNEAYAVQATSYALLVYLTNAQTFQDNDDIDNIVSWLQTMRNTNGGFASTQDTIVAIEALTRVAERDVNRALQDMHVIVEATSTVNWTQELVMSKQKDFGMVREYSVPYVYGSVRTSAVGNGRAMIQLSTFVNVEYPQYLRQPPEPSFEVYMDSVTKTGKNFSIIIFKPCAKWINLERAPSSGLAVIEVAVPTGYVVQNDQLHADMSGRRYPRAKHAEFKNQAVYFYFDYLTDEESCVEFRADRWYPVANATIQYSLKVYDYYEPGFFNFSLYTSYDLFNLHICHVCGSFECPYCPFYNAASALQARLFLLIFTCFALLILLLRS